MALSELAAIEAAYHTLRRLAPAGRRRALQWLSDALVASSPAESRAEPRAEPSSPAEKPSRRSVKTAKAAKAAPRKTKDGDRQYRRMPPADEVMAAYGQVGTVTGLAEHYGVPRYTVQGWARRLRDQGHQIGRNS